MYLLYHVNANFHNLDLYFKKRKYACFFIFTSSSYFGAVLEKAQSAGDLVLDKHLFILKIDFFFDSADGGFQSH